MRREGWFFKHVVLPPFLVRKVKQFVQEVLKMNSGMCALADDAVVHGTFFSCVSGYPGT